MTGKQIVTDLMQKNNVQNCDMAERLGISQAAMWDRLNPKKTDNMTIKILQELAGQLGYEIAVIPKGTVVEDAYYVGNSYNAPTSSAGK